MKIYEIQFTSEAVSSTKVYLRARSAEEAQAEFASRYPEASIQCTAAVDEMPAGYAL